jgi:hypothetical protein
MGEIYGLVTTPFILHLIPYSTAFSFMVQTTPLSRFRRTMATMTRFGSRKNLLKSHSRQILFWNPKFPKKTLLRAQMLKSQPNLCTKTVRKNEGQEIDWWRNFRSATSLGIGLRKPSTNSEWYEMEKKAYRIKRRNCSREIVRSCPVLYASSFNISNYVTLVESKLKTANNAEMV